MARCKIWIDGASRGNPGPAAIAYVVISRGSVITYSQTVGRATNNQAEYEALLAALSKASELGCEEVEVRSDSNLVIKQMRGEYKVEAPELVNSHMRAKSLERNFKSVSYVHVPREENRVADKLVNLALKMLEESRD